MSNTLLFFALFFLVSAVQAQSVVSSGAVTLENCGSVRFTDERDGKSYGTLKVGDQCWMAEDLRFGTCSGAVFRRHYRVSVSGEIAPGYWGVCREGRDVGSGYLYNWQGAMNLEDAAYGGGMVSDSSALAWRGICPEGWFLPRGGKGGDFQQLSDAFGGSSARLRSQSSGSFGGVLSGFTLNDTLHYAGHFGYYWSRNGYSPYYSYSFFLDTSHVDPHYYASARMAGLAVRCVRDIHEVTIDAGTINNIDSICAGETVIFSGSPATAEGVIITTYEWSVDCHDGGFSVIPDEVGATLRYSAFESGKKYIFKRKAIFGDKKAEVTTKKYWVPDMTITLFPTSVTIGADDTTTVTATCLNNGNYVWRCGTKTLSTDSIYRPLIIDFDDMSDSLEVICTIKTGSCIGSAKLNISSTVVSSTAVTAKNCGIVSFKDSRDNKIYRTVKIGEQCWMGQDLTFGKCESNASEFYNNSYGSIKDKIAPEYWGVCFSDVTQQGTHFYNWQGAMNRSDIDTLGITPQWRGVCPEGWYLPQNPEYSLMYDALGNIPSKIYPGLGIGEFRGTLSNGVAGIREHGCYWTSTYRYDSTYRYYTIARFMFDKNGYVYPRSDTTANYGHAVRCLRQLITAGIINNPDSICANTSVTFKGTPAMRDGIEPRTYQWYVKVDNKDFAPIPYETYASLTYSSFESGKNYVFRRDASFTHPSKIISVVTHSYHIPEDGYLDLESTAISVEPKSISINDLCHTETFKASGAVWYNWIYPNGRYVGGSSYKPYRHEFQQFGEYPVEVIGIFSNCRRARQKVLVTVDSMPLKHCEDSIHDSQGNVYMTQLMKDGRCWMTQNIRRTDVEHEIPYRSIDPSNGKPGYDENNAVRYGGLYTWDVMMQNSTQERAQGLCPDGWHIPCDGEWKALEVAYGMSSEDADREGTRISGLRSIDEFNLILAGGSGMSIFGHTGFYYTSSMNGDKAWGRQLMAPDGVSVIGNPNLIMRREMPKNMMWSVRCIRD